MREIKYLVIHCTAGHQQTSVEDIEAYWKSKGWESPGYHFIVRADGTYKNLLPITKVSNGVKGFNANSIHFAFIGGVEIIKKQLANGQIVNAVGKAIDNRTEAQKATLEKLVRFHHNMFPNAAILGHRDFSPDKNRDGVIKPDEWIKTCPSHSVHAWLKEIKFRSNLPFALFETTSRLNIRSGQGINFSIVRGPLPKGTKVRLLAEGNDWYYVQVVETKETGWVDTSYLRKIP